MVTFPVDDVTPAAEALPTQPLAELWPDTLAVGGDPALPVLVPNGVHPLLRAVGQAFAEHRPLVLSPDAVWLTIAQGVSRHVLLHAEELRPRLVSHAGRRRLAVTLDGPMPVDAPSWHDTVEQFQKLLAEQVADTDLFECDFSTSTDVDRVAGRIVLLEAYSPYYALWMVAVCGIPSITLTGTVEDWRRIRARVDALDRFGLEQWRRSLAPITDQFARAAAGDVDTAFWQRVYNPVDAYGGELITGWAARLYPYLSGYSGAFDRPNPLLELPLDEPRDITVEGRFYTGAGIRSSDVPATLSRAVVNVNDLVAGDNRAVALHGGLAAVTQDPDGALRPVAGWHLAPAGLEMDDVVDRIVRDHHTEPPDRTEIHEGPADLVALYHRIGSATLFDDAWRLLAANRRRHVWTPRGLSRITTIAELPDGRSLGYLSDFRAQTFWWVACRWTVNPDEQAPLHKQMPQLADDLADVPVYGTSLTMLLDAALDAGGDIAHLETGRLDGLRDAPR